MQSYTVSQKIPIAGPVVRSSRSKICSVLNGDYSRTEISLEEFYVHVTVHRNKFLFNKTNRRTNFPNLFCQETLHVSGSSSAHHQEFSTVHSALVYVMQV